MSDSSDEGDQRKAESSSRMWAESQPGPSRCPPSRQGYCGYCRVLYSNLDQHLSSLRHLDSVRASSRGSSTVSSSTSSSRTKLTLLERFLQDVLQHHPHRYNDPRPSHADLPSVSAPPLPRAELDELRFSDDDSRSLGTREHLSSSDDAPCRPANQKQDDHTRDQPGEGVAERADQHRLSPPIREQEEGGAAPVGHTQSSHVQTPPHQTTPLHQQAPPSVHRKAHRKTNRRKTSESSTSSLPHRGPDPSPYPDPHLCPDPSPRSPTQLRPHPDPSPCPGPGPQPPTQLRPCLDPGTCPRLGPRSPTQLKPHPDPGPCPEPGPRSPTQLRPRLGPGPLPLSQQKPHPDPGPCPDPNPWPPTQLRPQPDPGTCPGPGHRPPTQLKSRPGFGPCPGPGPWPPTDPGPWSLGPWLSWQKERREAQKEEAFSSDHSDSLDRTIEEVIQVWCHGVRSTTCQQEETESFHFSLPVSMETQSDDWDSPVQPGDSPVKVSQLEGRDLSCLMDVQVDLEDQVYSYQLDSALRGERWAGGGARQDEGFWNLPIEEVLPTPEHIPESFRGKTWTQIEQEDEEKVEKLVRQFRRGRFICYFDTESLARCGRRSQNKGCVESKEAEPDTCVLPLLDCDDDDSASVRRRRRRRRAFRVASRCQVVKVSHSTQTVHVVVPAVRQPASKALPTSVPDTNQDAAERTPEVMAWRCLPPSYSSIVTPLQPRTSLVYLLCSPSGPADTPALGSTPKRCRKKRRPLDPQGSKVKYKQLPVRFYDPSRNRILKNPPKGFQSGQPPSCVRQLFRSLSPDLNADRPPGEGAAGSSRVKGQRSTDKPFSHTNTFLLSTLSRDSAQTDKQDTVRRRGRMSQAPPPPPHSRSDRGRGGRRDRTRLLPSKRRGRAQATPPQATPPQTRREGLRRAGPGRKASGSPNPPPPPSPRRGRTRRGRGCDRGRR